MNKKNIYNKLTILITLTLININCFAISPKTSFIDQEVEVFLTQMKKVHIDKGREILKPFPPTGSNFSSSAKLHYLSSRDASTNPVPSNSLMKHDKQVYVVDENLRRFDWRYRLRTNFVNGTYNPFYYTAVPPNSPTGEISPPNLTNGLSSSLSTFKGSPNYVENSPSPFSDKVVESSLISDIPIFELASFPISDMQIKLHEIINSINDLTPKHKEDYLDVKNIKKKFNKTMLLLENLKHNYAFHKYKDKNMGYLISNVPFINSSLQKALSAFMKEENNIASFFISLIYLKVVYKLYEICRIKYFNEFLFVYKDTFKKDLATFNVEYFFMNDKFQDYTLGFEDEIVDIVTKISKLSTYDYSEIIKRFS